MAPGLHMYGRGVDDDTVHVEYQRESRLHFVARN
jgi:hypothetical protein